MLAAMVPEVDVKKGKNMNKIEVVAPIPIEELKKYFIDKNVFFVIDYENSTLKGDKLLTYLSNIDVPCDIKIKEKDIYDLMVEYFNSRMLVNLESLEKKCLEILLQYKYSLEKPSEEIEIFIEKNELIITKWISIIESLTIYNMSIIKKEGIKDFVESFPVIEKDDFKGTNFVSLLKYDYCYDLIGMIDPNNLFYYKEYFEDYCFKGKNLFSYWSNEKNPLFLLTLGYSDNIITFNENGLPQLVES